MSFFQDILGTLANSVLAWGANIAVFTAFLCLTGRFWQRSAAPALRRAGYTVAVYLSFIVLPQITSPLCALLHICFPGAVPEAVGALLWLPTAGRTPLPALRATDWALLAALLWLLGALACAAARLLPCWRFGKWLRANRRPLGKRAARVLQRAEEQLRAAGGLRPGGVLDGQHGLSPFPHPIHDAYVVDGLPGPMCVKGRLAGGPCLLLDREGYDVETLDAIFRHELSHLAPGGERLWGYEDLLAIFGWWNPAAWLLRRYLHDESELSCDAEANRGRTPGQRAAYARALTALAARKRTYLPGTAQLASKNGRLLRRRVRAVLEPPPHRRSAFAGVLFLLFATACVLCFRPLQDGAAVTEETFPSYLRAPHCAADGLVAPDGLYGAEKLPHVQSRGTIDALWLFYTDADSLALGRGRLEADLTARLGAPQRQTPQETVWQTEDKDGNATTVTLSRHDGRTLTLG